MTKKITSSNLPQMTSTS